MARVVIFSGAGISAESGLSTFRDTGGLWEKYRIEEICTAGCLSWNRENTLTFYDARREQLNSVKPNAAHYAIAKLQEKYPNDIALITQNVDDLFERAGCKDILHLHGFLPRLRCEQCGTTHLIGYSKQERTFTCKTCGGSFRPDIVFFGEAAPMYEHLYETMEDCQFLVIIGSSGNVIAMDHFALHVKVSILNNLEPSDAINERVYTKVLHQKATEAIDEIVEDIERFMQG
ncbi:SIR2 family NAD-dependent protein deacylase [Sulfurospirillum diekertiae]|uniref:protein acetyllysine N-acetyltransferase n=1 Tax=Sulfurospirillum diekertiae TaxID=1854492 RepID=A0A1Y0HLY3_9BACT|nr:Sir2 family NAD-dependent protein deacetylase [Sulfurospirillum diekertiae]ARU49108.1 NAD-dependent protein deacylase [Sulfurospirillum diekertiae]ASC93919.1 NAD-dependent protein deacylase [Sulfurospirillum diekertiae]